MARDLMHADEVKALVRDAYCSIAADTSAVAKTLYDPEQLESVPQSAIERSLGVGNHLRFADIKPGDVVLDLGCGAGIDTILAAHKTGPAGRVIGLDFLVEMLERTATAARDAGLDNIETLEGEIEAIPLPDASVDRWITSCRTGSSTSRPARRACLPNARESFAPAAGSASRT